MKIRILFILLIALLSISLTGCKKVGGISMKKEVYAQIVLTTGEKINLQLYPEYAPKTVENFVKNFFLSFPHENLTYLRFFQHPKFNNFGWIFGGVKPKNKFFNISTAPITNKTNK